MSTRGFSWRGWPEWILRYTWCHLRDLNARSTEAPNLETKIVVIWTSELSEMLTGQDTWILLSQGFKSSTGGTGVYCEGENLLLFYVDDILITGSETSLIDAIITKLNNSFEVVDVGEASYLLGWRSSVTRRRDQLNFRRNVYKRTTGDVRHDGIKNDFDACRSRTWHAWRTTFNRADVIRAATGSLLNVRYMWPGICDSVMALTRCMSARGKRAMVKLNAFSGIWREKSTWV